MVYISSLIFYGKKKKKTFKLILMNMQEKIFPPKNALRKDDFF